MSVSSANAWNGAGAVGRGGALDQRFALDVQGVDALRRTVRNSPEEGLKQVSRQFEALFMNMVLKSMREATPSGGLLESENEKVYLSLFDQQLAQNLSGRGLGLAEAMFAQLSRGMGAAAGAADPAAAPPAEAPAGVAPPPGAGAGIPAASRPAPTALPAGADIWPPPALAASPAPQFAPLAAPALAAGFGVGQVERDQAPGNGVPALQSQVDSFVAKMGASAQAASAVSGVPAPLILAQAALESGWGRREIRSDDGAQSFNLFGIKADRGWRGAVVETTTTEYVDGVAQRVRARFRAYGSYQEGFADYAKFLAGNPRYAGVLSASDPAEAAHGLQRAGYATDPQYGKKLVRIMQKLV